MADASGTDAERVALDVYIKEHCVEQAVEDMVQSLLEAKPSNPQKWLLNRLEQDLSNESEDLSESDLHRLFAVSRKITSEIVPQATIEIVICETLQLLNCDTVSLFVLDKKSGMLRLYASNLETPIVVSPGQGIAGSVFNSQQTVNIPDCYKDNRFDQSFDLRSGYVTRSLLAVPIIDFDGAAVGVIQAINKMQCEADEKDEDNVHAGMRAVPFARNDEKMLLHLTQHVGIAMRNAEVYREAISTSERATGLLNTIQSLSQDLGTQSLILTITMHANKIVSAQRSTVFLVDEEHQQLWSVSTDTGQEIRIPKRAGIAGQCCDEGTVINIPDAYADKRFNQEIDKKTGFKTQSILAIPMFDDSPGTNTPLAKRPSGQLSRVVIGVIQLINKVSFDGQLDYFDDSDIEIMELFSKFVGPKLAHSSLLATRTADNSFRTEAELGLPKVMAAPESPEARARKRMSNVALGAVGEDAEDAEEDEDQS